MKPLNINRKEIQSMYTNRPRLYTTNNKPEHITTAEYLLHYSKINKIYSPLLLLPTLKKKRNQPEYVKLLFRNILPSYTEYTTKEKKWKFDRNNSMKKKQNEIQLSILHFRLPVFNIILPPPPPLNLTSNRINQTFQPSLHHHRQ